MRTCLFIGLMAGLVVLTGCNGMVKTYDDRMNTIAQVLDSDMRQIADDSDAFWLADRQYRLTEWQLR